MPTLAIEVRGLRKSYGQNVAVDGIDLAVADIHALERISTVVFRGEIVDRPELLKAAKRP